MGGAFSHSSGHSIASFDTYDTFRPHSSICLVEYNSRFGTGAIVGLEFPEQTWRTIFITSHRVAPLTDLNAITELKLVFEDPTIGNICLTPQWVKKLWTSPADKLDVTVIEFSTTAMTILSRTNVARLLTSTVDPKEHNKVSVFQYLRSIKRGNETMKWFLNVNTGSISSINETIIEFSSNKTKISSGSLILNADYKVIALHLHNGYKSNKKMKAIRIKKILEAYQSELHIQYSTHTENEMWLQRINEIPQNEFELIGCGGYGKVYKIVETNGTIIALKLVEGFGGLDTFHSQMSAIKKEYQLVTSLQLHPRVIQFFAFVNDDFRARLVIIMEYLEGGSLYDLICNSLKSNTLNQINSLKYLKQILEGVTFIHKNGIYHSDIKPANILFTRNDDIKLCDFGIAVRFHTTDSSATSSSHLKGDLLYMSPERLSLTESRSAENDMWSVGATFVTMISGHPLNHNQSFPDYKIASFEIYINSTLLQTYIEGLPGNDYKRVIISRTLCHKQERSKAHELLQVCQSLSTHEVYIIDSLNEAKRSRGQESKVSVQRQASSPAVPISSSDIVPTAKADVPLPNVNVADASAMERDQNLSPSSEATKNQQVTGVPSPAQKISDLAFQTHEPQEHSLLVTQTNNVRPQEVRFYSHLPPPPPPAQQSRHLSAPPLLLPLKQPPAAAGAAAMYDLYSLITRLSKP